METKLPVVSALEEVKEDHSVFEIMGRNGDTKHTWDPENPEEVEQAKELFNYLKDKGFGIFKMKRFGGRGERMPEFDPSIGRMIGVRLLAVPPLAGG